MAESLPMGARLGVAQMRSFPSSRSFSKIDIGALGLIFFFFLLLIGFVGFVDSHLGL